MKREGEEEKEIKEIKIMPGFKEYVRYFFKASYGLGIEEKKKAPWIFKLVVFYLAQTKEIEVKISKEHKDFIWLSFEDALKKLTYKNAKEILKKANDYLMHNKKTAQVCDLYPKKRTRKCPLFGV